jgi:hypothetical protein
MNVGRMLLGGVVAGILLFMADGVIHEKLLHEHWLATMKAAGRSVQAEEHGASDMVYFATHDLLRGLALAWVYVAIRAHFGAGPKTAILAALAVWAIMFPIPFISLVPLGLYTANMLAMWSLYELIASLAAGLVAGALYKDAAAA